MIRFSLLALALSLYAGSASAGINLQNTPNPGDAGSAMVQSVTLTNGAILAVAPAL